MAFSADTKHAADDDDCWALFGDEDHAQVSSSLPTEVDELWALCDDDGAQTGASSPSVIPSNAARSNARLLVTRARAELLALATDTVPTSVEDLVRLSTPWPDRGARLARASLLLREGHQKAEALHEVARTLASEAFRVLETKGAWQHSAQRECFCIAAAMAAQATCEMVLDNGIVESRTADSQRNSEELLRAMRDADMCTVLGLPNKTAVAICAAVEAMLCYSGVVSETQHPGTLVARADDRLLKWPSVGAPPLMKGPAVGSVEATEMSCAEFKQHYFRQQAVTIRRLACDWPACTEWAGPEGLRRLARFHGHRTVPIELRDAEGSMRESLMLLREFIEQKLLAPDATDKAENGETAYLAQHDLFAQIPALRSFIVTPEHCQAGKLSNVSAWLGTGGTITRAHYDSYDNIFVQLTGRKYVRLLAQDQAPLLYRVKRARTEGSENGALTTSCEIGSEALDREETTFAQGNMSAIPDLENVDLERFPMASKATYCEVILEPGDALYIPEGVWHFVRSLSTSFSVNFWF